MRTFRFPPSHNPSHDPKSYSRESKKHPWQHRMGHRGLPKEWEPALLAQSASALFWATFQIFQGSCREEGGGFKETPFLQASLGFWFSWCQQKKVTKYWNCTGQWWAESIAPCNMKIKKHFCPSREIFYINFERKACSTLNIFNPASIPQPTHKKITLSPMPLVSKKNKRNGKKNETKNLPAKTTSYFRN